jgi:hypothetical protein
MNRRFSRLLTAVTFCSILALHAYAKNPDLQPLSAQAARVVEAMEHLGSPLPEADRLALQEAAKAETAAGIAKIQAVLDRHCLVQIQINPESRVKVTRGDAEARLIEQGWRTFLMKVNNEAGVTGELRIQSSSSGQLAKAPADQIAGRWLDLAPYVAQPMAAKLSGLGVEYRVVSLFSRDAGQREAKLTFDVGQGSQDLGFRSEIDILFTADAASELTLHVLDENGKPTIAGFVIRDGLGRIYPSQAKRLAPD